MSFETIDFCKNGSEINIWPRKHVFGMTFHQITRFYAKKHEFHKNFSHRFIDFCKNGSEMNIWPQKHGFHVKTWIFSNRGNWYSFSRRQIYVILTMVNILAILLKILNLVSSLVLLQNCGELYAWTFQRTKILIHPICGLRVCLFFNTFIAYFCKRIADWSPIFPFGRRVVLCRQKGILTVSRR